jgi:cytosine deaminase
MNLADYGISVGNPADIVVLDCESREAAVAELAQPLLALKRGRMSFSRPLATINWPPASTPFGAVRRSIRLVRGSESSRPDSIETDPF